MYVTIFVNKLFKLLGAYRDFHPSQAVLLLLLLLFTHQSCYCCYRLLTRLSCYCYCLLPCYCCCFPWQLHMSGQSCNLAMSQLKDGSSSLSFKSLWEKNWKFSTGIHSILLFSKFQSNLCERKAKRFWEGIHTCLFSSPMQREPKPVFKSSTQKNIWKPAGKLKQLTFQDFVLRFFLKIKVTHIQDLFTLYLKNQTLYIWCWGFTGFNGGWPLVKRWNGINPIVVENTLKGSAWPKMKMGVDDFI